MRRFRIGLLADIQHADIPNGSNYQKTRTRFYRGTINHVNSALAKWRTSSSNPDVNIVMDLGDTLDGYCNRLGHTQEALETLKKVFSCSHVPTYHVVGNHELYNIKRKEIYDNFLYSSLKNKLPRCAIEKFLCYFSLTPFDGYRLIVLDAYDVSVLGLSMDDQRYKDAEKLLKSYNSNEDLNDHHNIEKPQYVRYNGGIGEEQLNWLKKEIEIAREKREIVIIFSHVPFHSICCENLNSLLWNHDEISTCLGGYNDVVKLVICGHTHTSKHGYDESGILHVALPGLIEVPPDDTGIALLELSDDGIKIDGYGGLVPNISIPSFPVES